MHFNCDKSGGYLRAPAGFGVAHAPLLDHGSLAAVAVGSAYGTDHEFQQAFLDLDVVVTGFYKRNGIFGPLAAAEVAKRSLKEEKDGKRGVCLEHAARRVLAEI